MNKKKWGTPKLIVYARNSDVIRVLTACKEDGGACGSWIFVGGDTPVEKSCCELQPDDTYGS